jgi:hypothetical protein
MARNDIHDATGFRYTKQPKPLPTDEELAIENLQRAIHFMDKVTLSREITRNDVFVYTNTEKVIRLVADLMAATGRAMKRGAQ